MSKRIPQGTLVKVEMEAKINLILLSDLLQRLVNLYFNQYGLRGRSGNDYLKMRLFNLIS
ncbi:unnamed protein product [Paramecium sonneborni]|uniref:Uncharacterized protein n=1 Tax=Paramecium sonneborni TaxID=65129 RepID=A0A8S1RU70_9CILI|nr:unnamed protein product [Paramecium sonneborni]